MMYMVNFKSLQSEDPKGDFIIFLRVCFCVLNIYGIILLLIDISTN